MAKYEKIVTGDIQVLSEGLHKYILDSAVSMELIDQSSYEMGNTKVKVLVYDKYFMRNSSRASLNVTIVSDDDTIFVSAIGAGGSQGLFLNFSWGAESELVEVVEAYLKSFHYA